jgi:hypothetical protein
VKLASATKPPSLRARHSMPNLPAPSADADGPPTPAHPSTLTPPSRSARPLRPISALPVPPLPPAELARLKKEQRGRERAEAAAAAAKKKQHRAAGMRQTRLSVGTGGLAHSGVRRRASDVGPGVGKKERRKSAGREEGL